MEEFWGNSWEKHLLMWSTCGFAQRSQEQNAQVPGNKGSLYHKHCNWATNPDKQMLFRCLGFVGYLSDNGAANFNPNQATSKALTGIIKQS